MRLSSQLQQKLELLSFRSRQRILGTRQGGHRSIKRGYGSEFSDYRQYVPGDNPRHIDWGVFGRSDKLYIKQFHEEEEISVLVVLDASGSMTFGEQNSKWLLAHHLALAITFIALSNQDKVRLHILGGQTSASLFGSGALKNATRFLEGVVNTDQQNSSEIFDSLVKAASFVRYPGICLLISDFLFSLDVLKNKLSPLLAKNMDMHFLRVVSPEDTAPFASEGSSFRVRDSETGEEMQVRLNSEDREEYRKIYLAHKAHLENYSRAARAELVDVTLSTNIDACVLEALAKSSFVTT